MKTLRYWYAGVLALLLFAGCNVHEWPVPTDMVPFKLRLVYDTDMTIWEHDFTTGKNNKPNELGQTRAVQDHGYMRYIIRAYRQNGALRASSSNDYIERQFTREITDTYDIETTLELAPGTYTLMVWADMTESKDAPAFHDVDDFSEIRLTGTHAGCTDFRDAFSGTLPITLTATIEEHEPALYVVDMTRPVAKYEFITNDLVEFLERESTRVRGRSSVPGTRGLDDYTVAFFYVGYMPNTYNMFNDDAVDSSTGVLFRSKLSQLDEHEATMGFDYVFVHPYDSAVSVQIGIYDSEGTQVSMTDPITVPLRRSYHTIIRGSYLMSNASGGVEINPDFDGDHNIVIP